MNDRKNNVFGQNAADRYRGVEERTHGQVPPVWVGSPGVCPAVVVGGRL
jgi:hypothetical protein